MKTVKTTVNGIETTLRLSDEDAKAYDVEPQQKRRDEPKTKARKSVDNKSTS